MECAHTCTNYQKSRKGSKWLQEREHEFWLCRVGESFPLIGSVKSAPKLRWVRFGGKWMMGCLHEKRRRWVREGGGRMAERMVVYSYLISSWVREAGR